MDRPRVLITRFIPKAAADLIAGSCEVDQNREDQPMSKRELKARLKGKQGLLCLLTDTVDREVMEGAPGLKIIANVAVGYDNIDVAAASVLGIMVTNTPGVLDETTADLAWALMMAAARRVVEADRYVRMGKFEEWGLMLLLGNDIHGKTLGVIGLGRIGRAVAHRAKGFNMKVLYHARRRASEEVERDLSATYVDLELLLRESDFITLHIPLTAETHHLISRRELAMMKQTAYLVNTSRGPVVDEEALAQALRDRRIAGAALDVYEREPAITPALIELDNVVLAPHIGSATWETRSRMALIAAENLVAALSGRRPANLVVE